MLNWIEERVLASILGVMVIMTFANVVARYVFNDNIFYALEMTVFLFAWLVLLGSAYAIKHNMHIGVDFFVHQVSAPARYVLALIVVACCLVYALLLLKGSWDYWAPYANLPPTEGRWFPLGFVEKFRERGWYETKDIPVPFFLTWLSAVFNHGEEYEKLPKLVPYLVMPLATFLFVWRFSYVALKVWRGEQEMLIVSHEAEAEVAEASAILSAKLKETD